MTGCGNKWATNLYSWKIDRNVLFNYITLDRCNLETMRCVNPLLIFIALVCAIVPECFGQGGRHVTINIDNAIAERDYTKAEKILKGRLNELYAARQYDSLPKYVEYV